MKNVPKIDLGLTGYDELFMNDTERMETKLPHIYDIPLELIDDFPDHPFKVRDDEDMMQLVESVKERGIITPVTLRPKEDGRYEIVSGHRRKKACELAGFETVKAEVREMTRDEAIILMVESNFQRSQILPSEKAFAYKMRLEAMKRQAGRPSKENSVPVAQNYEGKTSRELLGEQVGESQDQIRRYIRLTHLVPELRDYVDEGKIKMRPAVELSYLDEESQRAVVDEIDLNQFTPSHDQTIRMRKFFTDGKLTPEVVSAIMGEEKKKEDRNVIITGAELEKYFGPEAPVDEMKGQILALLDEWNKPKPQGGGDPEDGDGNRIVWSPVFHFYGNTTKEEAVEAARMSFAEFKKMYKQMKAEERRKKFAPA